MKSVLAVLALLICISIISCESHHAAHVNSDPRADSAGSGAKMINAGGKTNPDSVIIDSSNYGRPKN